MKLGSGRLGRADLKQEFSCRHVPLMRFFLKAASEAAGMLPDPK